MIVRVAVPEEHVGPATLEPALEATTRVNESMIAAGQLPLLDDALDAGVRWQPEPPGYESFDHGGIVLARKNGDCDDLASWHTAGLRATGEDPGARAVVVRTGPTLWHAVVERSDGTIDDPSEWAGMPSASFYTPPTHAPMVNGRCYVGIWQHGPTTWRARMDVPVGVAGCCDHKPDKCCACSVTYDAADPRLAIAQAAHGAHVLGGHAGAASDDLAKLQALAALSRGISQRKLIDHVDPDLLLCAVLLNQTLERKLQALAPHLMRRPLEPAHFDLAPTTADTGPPASYAMQGRGWPGRRWPVDLRGRDFGGAMASFAHPACDGMTRSEALDWARGFQRGMAQYWSSPEGAALTQANAIAKKYGLAKYGITGSKIVNFWRDHQELSIPQAAHALYLGARFQRGMARFWASRPKQFWQASPPEVRAAIHAASKRLGMPVGAVVQELAAQRAYQPGAYPRPWTPDDLIDFAQGTHDEHGNPSPSSLPDAIVALMPDYTDPLLDFPNPKELAASEHAAAMVKQRMVEALGGSVPPPEVVAAGEKNARAQTFLQLATSRMRKAGKKTSPRFEHWAAVAEDAATAFDDAWEWMRAAMLEAGTGMTTADAASMAAKVVQVVATVIASII